MRLDQYAFVPAAGGLLAPDGRLPSVVNSLDMKALQALLPPTRFLRVAAHVQVGPEHVLRLRVFEPVDAPGLPPDEIAVPGPLRPAFARCTAELAGAPPPPRRPAWSQPGWHEQAEAWAGTALEQVRLWPLSAVLRSEDAVFKAVFPLFHHEPAITEAVGMPHVLQSDHVRGWMLLEHLDAGADPDHHAAMRALARIHRAWASRVDEALALGAPDRRTPSALPHTLVHGDFHPGNVLGATIIDWSDAAVANPLHDVNYYLLYVDDELRGPLLDVYAESWPGIDVHAEAATCEAETFEWIAQSYAGITAAVADDDRWWFAGEEERWLARASDVRAGRRPSPDT
jgi:hypothetical protein